MKEITQEHPIDKDAINAEVRKRYPSVRLFGVTHPYGGYYVIRQQTLKDVREASVRLKNFVEERIAKAGGQKAIEALDEEAQTQLQQQINADYADLSNEIVLTQCVVYPYDFAEKFSKGEIPGGIIPFLLERIMEISCWGDAEVEDI